ncbi:MAG TPA: DinB family protein [Thermoanaerobaculia bacterium]|nr:DinB family protein [Thermoanaerobaculia bacterium]
MFALETLRDLYRHMEWADAAVWSAMQPDDDLVGRLHHIQMTQSFFLKLWREEPIDFGEVTGPGTADEVLAAARKYYDDVHPFLAHVTAAELERKLDIPWAAHFARGGVVVAVTMAEAMFQVTSHSTYHRGQVNARLRAIGGVPPNVDYIAWLWAGRPAPEWPAR